MPKQKDEIAGEMNEEQPLTLAHFDDETSAQRSVTIQLCMVVLRFVRTGLSWLGSFISWLYEDSSLDSEHPRRPT
ncbi:hypothetical protein ACFLWS_01500 [Chloroflexota bacterium]